MTEEPLHQPLGDQASNNPPLRPIPPELQDVLDAHKNWLNSRGILGKAANLSKYDFEHLDLSGIIFRDATLTGARFSGANLHQTDLRGADLTDADLSGADNLQLSQLGGADLQDAQLPEHIRKFEELGGIAEASRLASHTFLAMLAACVYSWLTVAATTDAALITNTATSSLPVIQTSIPIVGFYLAAPLLLLAVYLYLHINLQRLWEGLAALPAIFPDGRRLDQAAYPWFLLGLVCAYSPRLRPRRPPFSHLQALVSLTMAWLLVPLTLLFIWARYLPRRDWILTGLHILLIMAALWFLCQSLGLARATLRLRPPRTWLRRLASALAPILGGALCLVAAWLVIQDDRFYRQVYISSKRGPESPVAAVRLCKQFTLAQLQGAELSGKPPQWLGKKPEDLALIKGARLAGRNLRYMQANRAFLALADLRGADLRGADLRQANLEGANLYQADLIGADLNGANLKSATLFNAFLDKADLHGADLKEADLHYAYFTGARGLTWEQVLGAYCWLRANFDKDVNVALGLPRHHGTSLLNDDFSRYHLPQAQLKKVRLYGVKLREAHLQGANLQEALLTEADFREANLEKADLSKADLTRTNFQGANLRGAEFYKARLQDTCFAEADLTGAKFNDTDLRKADLAKANLEGAYLGSLNLNTARLRGARLHRANLGSANLAEADLQGADLRQANLGHADLTGANLQDADLTGAQLNFAKLTGARLQGAQGLSRAQVQEADHWLLAHYDAAGLGILGLPPDHDQRLPEKDFRGYDLAQARLYKFKIAGVNFAGAHLQAANLELAEIPGGDFQGADLRGAKLAFAKLERANLEGVNLERANLGYVHLEAAVLRQANLQGAVLSHAYLQGADLRETRLQGADLYYANFQGAQLAGAQLTGANLFGADLRGAQGIEPGQVRAARNTLLASYDAGMLGALGLPRDHPDRLKKRDLQGYQLPAADLTGAAFFEWKLPRSNLRYANLTGAYLGNADLQGANLAGAILKETFLGGADLRGVVGLEAAQIKEARAWLLADCDPPVLAALGLPPDHRERLQRRDLRGYDLRGIDLRGGHLQSFDLRHADLRGARLQGAMLWGANLREANLEDADLRSFVLQGNEFGGSNCRGLNLAKSVLQSLDFQGVALAAANFQGAKLYGVKMAGANLQGANLQAVEISWADLQGADLKGADLRGADLKGAQNLIWDQVKQARRDEHTKLPEYLLQTGTRRPRGRPR